MSSEQPSLSPGLGTLLLGIFIRPRRALQAVIERNGRVWWAPALILLAWVVVVAAISGPIAARATRDQILQMQSSNSGMRDGQTDPAQMEQTLGFITSPVFTIVLPAASGVVGLLIGWLAQAGLLYLSATVLGGRTRFGALWCVVLWTAMPFALRSILQAVFILLTGKVIQYQGLSGLVVPPAAADNPMAVLQLSVSQRVLVTVLGQVDLFVFWNLALLTIGVAIATHFSHRKAALIVLALWGLGILLNVLIAVGSASFTGGMG